MNPSGTSSGGGPSLAQHTAASRVPFADFCTLCERLRAGSSRAQRLERWSRFLAHYRQQVAPTGGDSMHTLLRLLLPERDRLRGAYGSKHHRLAELYCAALRLPRSGDAAGRLLGYRSSGGVQHGGGDFGETLQHVLQNRCPERDSGWSMQTLDDTLTQLAEQNQANDSAGMKDTIAKVALTLSAREQKWVARVILKEMHLGVGVDALLKAFHPDAVEHYAVSSCLRRMAVELADPSRRLHEIQITLFTAFRPMLSERSGLESIDRQMRHRPFYVEPKHDGERVQLHRDGDRYMFFSRGGFDFTDAYGASPAAGALVPHIHGQFSDTVHSCIIDGEMLVWNDIEKRIIVKAEAPDVKKLKPGGRIRPMFVPFDLVYLNGAVLTERPLSERLEKLKSVFRPLEGRLEVTTRLEASTTEEVVEALNAAIDRQEEGLVLKDPHSLYRPNARRAGWVKVKPDYVDSLVDDLDMVIIGGYFGTGARRGTVCQFLLGAAEPPERDGDRPQLFLSAGTVSSGLTDQQLRQLQQQLMPHMAQPRRDGRPPPGLRWAGEKPDLWIEPSNSQILQIKATEVVESSKHACGLVPRFARVVGVRTDKHWYDCVTTAELKELRLKAGGKLATGHLKGVPARSARSGARGGGPGPAVAPHLRPTDLTGLQTLSSLLQGHQLCVMTCSKLSDKSELERLIHQCGGTLTQNPTAQTWAVVADRITVKERNVITSGQWDLVRSSWVRRVHAAGRLLPFSPAELLHGTAATAGRTLLHYDRHGDSYTEDVGPAQLRALIKEMPADDAAALSPPPELAELAAGGAPFSALAGCRCFLAPPLHGATVAGLRLRLHGGRLAGTLDECVTHVIVAGRDGVTAADVDQFRQYNRRRQRKIHLVSERWVEESARRGQRAEERAFPPL